MSALLEVVGMSCDYCDARVDFPNPVEPPKLDGWTVGTFDEEGNNCVIPIDFSVFVDVDPIALVACPKEECQKGIRVVDELPILDAMIPPPPSAAAGQVPPDDPARTGLVPPQRSEGGIK